MSEVERLRHWRRLRLGTAILMLGLVLSGLTAIPIRTQFEWAARGLGQDFRAGGWIPEWAATWLVTAHRGVLLTAQEAPFVYYGTDWLAFGHIVIALVFVGAWKDPIRNRWLFQFAMWACALVVPWALVFGAVRGIPLWWRGIDSLFGLFGFLPAWCCHRSAQALEITGQSRSSQSG